MYRQATGKWNVDMGVIRSEVCVGEEGNLIVRCPIIRTATKVKEYNWEIV